MEQPEAPPRAAPDASPVLDSPTAPEAEVPAAPMAAEEPVGADLAARENSTADLSPDTPAVRLAELANASDNSPAVDGLAQSPQGAPDVSDAGRTGNATGPGSLLHDSQLMEGQAHDNPQSSLAAPLDLKAEHVESSAELASSPDLQQAHEEPEQAEEQLEVAEAWGGSPAGDDHSSAAEAPQAADPMPCQGQDSNATDGSCSAQDTAEPALQESDASSHERSYGTWPDEGVQDESSESANSTEASRPADSRDGGADHVSAEVSREQEPEVQLLTSTSEQLPLPSFDESLSPKQMHEAWASDRSLHPTLDEAQQEEQQGGNSLLAADPAESRSGTLASRFHDEL